MKQKHKYIVGIAAVLILGVWTGYIKLDKMNLPFSVAQSGDSAAIEGCDQKVPISTLTFSAQDMYSGSVDSNGVITFYDPSADPKNPTASALDTITLSSGKAATTNKIIRTCTPYKVIYDGASPTDYDEDLGVMMFDIKDFSAETGVYTYPNLKVTDIGTFEDMLEEDAIDGSVNGVTSGNTSLDVATVEIGCLDAALADGCTLVYDESQADGSVFLDLKIGNTAANTGLKNVVWKFIYETGAAPEGTEITSITAQTRTGTISVPSELVSYWTTQTPIHVTDLVTGGQSSTIRLTFTYVESALDANDDFILALDDLGDYLAQDVKSGNSGASAVTIDFDAQA